MIYDLYYMLHIIYIFYKIYIIYVCMNVGIYMYTYVGVHVGRSEFKLRLHIVKSKPTQIPTDNKG